MTAPLREFRARDGYARWIRRTDTPLLVLALLFALFLLLPVVVALSADQQRALWWINAGLWAIFTVDYVARLYLAADRWSFVRSHPLDLAIVLLPMLRPFRALRAVRVLRLAAVAGVAQRRATRSLHARVTTYVVSAVVVALVVAGVAVREAERDSEGANILNVWDGMWWAVTTVTTVGYGDRYPTTPLGRMIALVLMLVGIALIGVVTGAIATWFVDRITTSQETVEETIEESDRAIEARFEQVLAELRDIRVLLEDHPRPTHSDSSASPSGE